MFVILFEMLLLAAAVISIVYAFKTNKRSLVTLDPLIIATDHGDKNALQRLYAERDRLKISDEAFMQYRRSMYTRLAQNGDAFAEYQLGEDARIFWRQPRAAYDHLQRAASMGCTEAMVTLGLLYSVGDDGFEQNLPLSFKWYMTAANAGNTEAMAKVASCYCVGYGVEESKEAAIAWATKGAKAGSAACMFELSVCYHMMPLSPENTKMRLQYLEQAMRMGDREIYEKAAKELGGIFGNAYIYNFPVDSFADRRKAAYCLSLAWFCDPDNDSVRADLQKIGYQVPRQEFEQWRADAGMLRYNP